MENGILLDTLLRVPLRPITPAFTVGYLLLAVVALAHSAVSLRRRYKDLLNLDREK